MPTLADSRNDHDLAALLARIVAESGARQPPLEMTTRIVAIDGPGRAGKSTLAEHAAVALGGAAIIRTDDFASWENPMDWWPLVGVHLRADLQRRGGSNSFGA